MAKTPTARIEIGGTGYELLKRLPDKLTQALQDKGAKALDAALQAEQTQIAKRTTAGADVNGQAFAPYTAKYARWKNEHPTGRKGGTARGKRKAWKGAAAASVTLTLSGAMLRGMMTEVKANGLQLFGRMFFTPDQAVKARANQTGKYGRIKSPKPRRFFALAKEQIERVTQALRKALNVR